MNKKSSNVFRGLSNVFVSLMCILIVATMIAESLKPVINSALGTTSLQVVVNEDGSTDLAYFKSEFNSVTELIAAREAINEQVVEEGAVLLKNLNSALPLAANSKVTFLGNGSHQAMYGSTSGNAAPSNAINAGQLVTYEEAFIRRGIELNQTMIDFYESLRDEFAPAGAMSGGSGAGYTIGEVPIDRYTNTQISSFASYNDAAIIFLTRNAGEGADIPYTDGQEGDLDADKDGLDVQDAEWAVINLAKEHFDKVIIFLNTNNPIACGDLQADPDIDAIVYTGGVGTKGAYGIADLILGTENFSGGVVDTFATDNHSSAAMQNFGDYTFANAADIPNTSYGTKYLIQAEGVYVGYKYYETRYEDAILGQGDASGTAGMFASTGSGWNYADEMVYPFGYGLSYTTFSEKITGITRNDRGDVIVTVEVQNTGDVSGKDNVQLYMQAPYTDYDKQNLVEKPFTFVGCVKTDNLAPNATATVEITVDYELLPSYDYINAKAYVLDGGEYYFAVGDGAHDAVNNMLAKMGATGMVDQEGNSVTGNADAATTITIGTAGQIEIFDEYDEGNGYKITNQFQDYLDLNSFQPGTVTYLTRQDWQGTFPKSYVGIVATGVSPNGYDMLAELSGDTYTPDPNATIDFKYGNPDNTDYSVAMMIGNTDWDDEGWDLLLNQMSLGDYLYITYILAGTAALDDPINDGHDGANVGYPGRTGEEGPTGQQKHYRTTADLATMNTPYYMTPEEENMEVDGVKYTDYWLASMHQQTVLASTFNPALARRMGEIFGEDTLWAHQTSHEIGANNHRSPYGGRNNEYYSEDANLAYIMGYEESAGIESKGGRAMPKHYVGNDQETNRQGVATFNNEAAFREIQLRSVEGAFRKAGAKESMAAFSRLGVIQASYSKEMWDIVRKEWGHPWSHNFTDMGLDGLQYGVRSIVAGTDNLLVMSYVPGEGYAAVVNAQTAAENPELATALRENAKRMLYSWANSNDANGYSSNVEFVRVTTWWEMALFAADVALGVIGLAFAVLYVASRKKGGNK